MNARALNCELAKRIDLVEFLGQLGHHPRKIRNRDYWYLSPLRVEKTPSFKVNRRMNVWFDHGTGNGGSLIDFGILYYRCSVKELLSKLDKKTRSLVSFQQPTSATSDGRNMETRKSGRIEVISTQKINDPSLLKYLDFRRIPLTVANTFCHEVAFKLYGKNHLAIGFRNDQGGYELRNTYFKGSSSPKTTRFLDNRSPQLVVLEGLFDFLSYQVIYGNQSTQPDDFLILNSLAFVQKAIAVMERHRKVLLYLDRDPSGLRCAKELIKSGSRYVDESIFYTGSKDLNDWLVKTRLQNQFLNK